jgi:predicted aspartyl protease
MRIPRRSFLAASLLLPGLVRAQLPTIPPAMIDDSLEIDGDPLAAERSRSRLFVDVGINDSGPYRFLVDSGADRSVVGAALAASLGLPSAGMAMLQSMAGRSQVQTVEVASLSLGPSTTRNLRLPALPEAWIGAQGLIGIDALGTQRILLDYERRQVTVQSSSIAPPRTAAGDEEIVVTARRRKGQLILTQVRAAGQSLYAVVDSGSEVTLGNMALAQRLFSKQQITDPKKITLLSVTGEPLIADLGILPELRVGSLILRGLPIAFADAGPFALFGLANTPALLLGSDVLQVFRRVGLDFGNRRVRFTLKRN